MTDFKLIKLLLHGHGYDYGLWQGWGRLFFDFKHSAEVWWINKYGIEADITNIGGYATAELKVNLMNFDNYEAINEDTWTFLGEGKKIGVLQVGQWQIWIFPATSDVCVWNANINSGSAGAWYTNFNFKEDLSAKAICAACVDQQEFDPLLDYLIEHCDSEGKLAELVAGSR
jgi:hypothetical protein